VGWLGCPPQLEGSHRGWNLQHPHTRRAHAVRRWGVCRSNLAARRDRKKAVSRAPPDLSRAQPASDHGLRPHAGLSPRRQRNVARGLCDAGDLGRSERSGASVPAERRVSVLRRH